MKKEKANNFFKFVEGINKWAVDYDKLDQQPEKYIVIISERMLRMKTYGAKEFTFRKWKEKGTNQPNTLWLRNLADDVKLETASFCVDVPEPMRQLKPYNEGGRVFINEGKDKYAVLGAVNSPRTLRGSRIPVDYVVWDEFNDSIRFTRQLLVPNFDNLMSSTGRIVKAGENTNKKIFILGNNRTMNHPLFIKWGISHINEEITRIPDKYGKPLILIICPKITDEEIKQIEIDNRNNSEFQMSKLLGTAGHMYFNQSDSDDLNGIIEYFKPQNTDYSFLNQTTKEIMLIRVDDQVLGIFNVKDYLRKWNNRWHVISLTLLENVYDNLEMELPEKWFGTKFVSNSKQQRLGDAILNNQVVDKLMFQVSKGNFSFENVVSKDYFFRFLNKQ